MPFDFMVQAPPALRASVAHLAQRLLRLVAP
jgi:hypothetical protein